ncbi:MAG: hypothetical protein SFU98_19405 [Leptospiraceae bacterium]|nr:hypothetical protein [Leptospiraceae bacterium]
MQFNFQKIILLTLLLFYFLYCLNFEQVKNGKSKPIPENTGYLKLKIIDSVNNDTFSISKFTIRGIRELPIDEQSKDNFENNYDFLMKGSIKDNEESVISLKEGEYYIYLEIQDLIIRPLLVSDLSSKSIYFGYKSEYKHKGIFAEWRGYQFTKIDEPNCKDKITDFCINFCKPLKIEKGKLTEIALKFDKTSEFNGVATGLFWVMTVLTPLPGLGAPMILIGTIIVTRNIEYKANVKDVYTK